MAEKSLVQELTGYPAGAIPLIGHRLPCIFDHRLLAFDYVYGGSGDELHTLKIAPNDVIRLNDVIGFMN
ncbi:YbaK / prolyl-tRNA synthetases associated domain protein [compost metagenome]